MTKKIILENKSHHLKLRDINIIVATRSLLCFYVGKDIISTFHHSCCVNTQTVYLVLKKQTSTKTIATYLKSFKVKTE